MTAADETPDLEIVVSPDKKPYRILRAIEQVAERHGQWPNVRGHAIRQDIDGKLLIGIDIIDLSAQKNLSDREEKFERNCIEKSIKSAHQHRDLKACEKKLKRMLATDTSAVRVRGVDVGPALAAPEPSAPEADQVADLAVHRAEGYVSDARMGAVSLRIGDQSYVAESRDLLAGLDAVLAAGVYLPVSYFRQPVPGVGMRRVICRDYVMMIAHMIAEHIGPQGELRLPAPRETDFNANGQSIDPEA